MTQRSDISTAAQQANAADTEARIAVMEALTGAQASGGQVRAPVVVAAAGATQGNATAIPSTAVDVIVTVTASTEGVKLPTAATGKFVTIWADPLVGVKVYPGTNGKIGSASTNAAVALAKNKVNRYYAKNTTQWLAQVGA